jgi:hypothetical protein
MRNRSDLPAYNSLHQYLVERGFKPQLQKLDNEASKALKRSIREKGIDYQLVPPQIHRQNAAERAIQTFKNHFIVCLGTTDKHFHFTCGIAFYPKPSQPSISFGPPASTLDSQRKNTYSASPEHQILPWIKSTWGRLAHSNEACSDARRIYFSFLIKFGIPAIFLTITPDDLRNFRIVVYSLSPHKITVVPPGIASLELF